MLLLHCTCVFLSQCVQIDDGSETINLEEFTISAAMLNLPVGSVQRAQVCPPSFPRDLNRALSS